jgi:hypothetical protein
MYKIKLFLFFLVYFFFYNYYIINSCLATEGFQQLIEQYYRIIEIVTANDKWRDKTISGQDTTGKKAEFKIRILSQEYRWRLGSSEQIEIGRIIDESWNRFKTLLKSDNMQHYMNKASDIICLGLASEEGVEAAEQNRTDVRADVLADLIRENLPKDSSANIYVLSLGKFINDGNDRIIDTSYQRRIVLISVIEKNPEVDICTALNNALLNYELQTTFDIRKYSSYPNYQKKCHKRT